MHLACIFHQDYRIYYEQNSQGQKEENALQRNKTPEEYQAELMRLYQSSHHEVPIAAAAQPTASPQAKQSINQPEEQLVETPPQPVQKPPQEPEEIPSPEIKAEPQTISPSEPEPLPKEALPPLPEQIAPILETIEPPAEDMKSIGWIQVMTRSAKNAMAIPGVSVLITNSQDSTAKSIQYALVTDESGETEPVPLPAPDIALSLSSNETQQPYSTFDVSVSAPGYFRLISKAVPVFAGTTSRQIFSMIPLPIYPMDEPGVITYENTEPKF